MVVVAVSVYVDAAFVVGLVVIRIVVDLACCGCVVVCINYVIVVVCIYFVVVCVVVVIFVVVVCVVAAADAGFNVYVCIIVLASIML